MFSTVLLFYVAYLTNWEYDHVARIPKYCSFRFSELNSLFLFLSLIHQNNIPCAEMCVDSGNFLSLSEFSIHSHVILIYHLYFMSHKQL